MEKVKAAAEWAKKMADGLPDEYRLAAFQEFLRFRLSNETNPPEGPRPVRKGSKKTKDQPTSWLSEIKDKLPADHIIREKGSEDQKVAWAVIGLVHSNQLAINKEIRDYIRLNLGIAPPSRQNTNRALRNLIPKSLSREKSEEEKGLVYLPKPSIIDVFSGL